ncbi:MAG: prolyl oligopeptidase family serine peptidase [Planctomycetota bacterium]
MLRPPIRILSCFIVCAVCSAAVGQSDWLSKKTLEHESYDRWSSLGRASLSRDGKWVQYVVDPQKDEAPSVLHVAELGGSKHYTLQRPVGPRWTQDSKHLVVRLSPDPKRVEKLQGLKGKFEEYERTNLAILNLDSGDLTRIDRVRSYQLPDENGRYIAYLLEKGIEEPKFEKQSSNKMESYTVSESGLTPVAKPPKLKKRSPEIVEPEQRISKEEKEGENPETKSDKSKDKPKEKKKEPGTTLVIHDLEEGTSLTFANVVRYTFSEDGSRLAFVTSVPKTTEKKSAELAMDGVFIVELSEKSVARVLSGRGEYKNLAFSEDGKSLALISNHEDYAAETPSWSVFLWKHGEEKATSVASETSPATPKDWWVSSRTSPYFSKDGRRLYFHTAPIPASVIREPNDEEEPEESKVKLDVWHWQDPYLQPEQLLRARQDRDRQYLAVFHLKEAKGVQLATPAVPSVSVSTESKLPFALANSDVPYRTQRSWVSPGYQDVYLIHQRTGKRTQVLEGNRSFVSLSPTGRFGSWFDPEQRHWYCFATNKPKEAINASQAIRVPLQNELEDRPRLAPPHGTAGWISGDKALWVYDRFDIWSLDPTGAREPICVTGGVGRKTNTRFRLLRLSSESPFLDADGTLLLSAFNLETKASGFYKLDPKELDAEQTPQRLIELDESLRGLVKARDTDRIVFTRSSFRRFPDLWTSTTAFKKIQRLTDVNPQQQEYRWGDVKLVSWKSPTDTPLTGMLYTPDGFDPSKKYPMMVYYYERRSDNLHSYYIPATSRSVINFSFYVSRGYVIFVPDIPYRAGEPGPSAVDSVLSGVDHVVDMGFVDEAKIGMQGHSWGGYQAAYLVTQTDRFACAEAGAPVSNMTSAYGGIRWGSGRSRMFQYEREQSRIGDDLWKARDKYIANSPLFFADKINTPLLILHNDEDGAVPWYQGIELFVAMRRLKRPAWLLNYNGEPHWVMKRENQKDFTIRMQQFFDHYLKDAPEPEWMAVGVPAVKKGVSLGLELLEPEKKEADVD